MHRRPLSFALALLGMALAAGRTPVPMPVAVRGRDKSPAPSMTRALDWLAGAGRSRRTRHKPGCGPGEMARRRAQISAMQLTGSNGLVVPVYVGFDAGKDGDETTVRARRRPDGVIEVLDVTTTAAGATA